MKPKNRFRNENDTVKNEDLFGKNLKALIKQKIQDRRDQVVHNSKHRAVA